MGKCQLELFADPKAQLGEVTTWNKSEIVRRLHAMVVSRLFGDGKWRGDRESNEAAARICREMDLWEPVPDSVGDFRYTSLGQELNVQLMDVFLGTWEDWGVPLILREHGLIGQMEADELSDRLERGRDPEKVLKPAVQNAYRAYCNSAKWRH